MTALEASSTVKDAARTAVQTARGTMDTMAGGLASFMSFNSMLLEAYTEAGRAYVKQLTALNEELTAFTNRRLKEQSEIRGSLAKCTDWGDAMRTQQSFLQNSSKEYLDEAARLFQLIGKATLAGVGPLMEKMETLPQHLSKADIAQRESVSGSLNTTSTQGTTPRAA